MNLQCNNNYLSFDFYCLIKNKVAISICTEETLTFLDEMFVLILVSIHRT